MYHETQSCQKWVLISKTLHSQLHSHLKHHKSVKHVTYTIKYRIKQINAKLTSDLNKHSSNATFNIHSLPSPWFSLETLCWRSVSRTCFLAFKTLLYFSSLRSLRRSSRSILASWAASWGRRVVIARHKRMDNINGDLHTPKRPFSRIIVYHSRLSLQHSIVSTCDKRRGNSATHTRSLPLASIRHQQNPAAQHWPLLHG